MAPRGSWGTSTPQAKPKPKLCAPAPGGPAVDPAGGGDLRDPDAGGGDPSQPAMRPPQGVWSDPRPAGTPPVNQPAAAAGSGPAGAQRAPSPGMCGAVPMFGAMRRPTAAPGGRPPMGMPTGQDPSTVVPGYRMACGTPASLVAAADSLPGPPPGTAASVCQGPPAAPGAAPAPTTPVHGSTWPGRPTDTFVGGWPSAVAAAPHDAPVPGPVAAAPAAAALPGGVALDHGNHPSKDEWAGLSGLGASIR